LNEGTLQPCSAEDEAGKMKWELTAERRWRYEFAADLFEEGSV